MVDLAKLLHDIEDDIDLNEGLGLSAEFSLRCKVAIRELAAERDALKAEIEAARKQSSTAVYMGEHYIIGGAKYYRLILDRKIKDAAKFELYARPVPAQQAESPWQVITNENWNIPKLGQRVILFSNGAIQNDSYTLDRGDDGYFWSRDDVDECPEVKAGDAWMPWPSEFRGVK